MEFACVLAGFGQESEPEFIGEAFFLKSDDGQAPLDKEIADFKSGISWSANAWNAISIEIPGGKAQTRFRPGEPLKLVVRAADNNFRSSDHRKHLQIQTEDEIEIGDDRERRSGQR
jgi:hypothetical protein